MKELELIYSTNPFIYPAMFGNKQNAMQLLLELFKSLDEMFRLNDQFYKTV